MAVLDWIVLAFFFLLILIIGLWSVSKNKSSRDFFVASGNMPWWLSGISHHVSGYSGAVFVAYSALAYTHGLSLYFWWAFTIGLGLIAGTFLFIPRWARLRKKYDVQSPLEYLLTRYNLPAQQLMAWSGVILKLFDVGAKWAAIAILLREFTGTSLLFGILLAGGISIIYITIGGLWAVILTDFAQFIVQLVAGLLMFFLVLDRLGGISGIWTLWDQLPQSNARVFHAPYTAGFAITFLFINFLSYNGGTWNLATRFIALPSGTAAKRSAWLSAFLYFTWPLILFFPMWAAPVFLPGLEDPATSYARMTQEFLPPGLVGLVLASLFANTLTMTSSDANTIASVITRDILPVFSQKIKTLSERRSLYLARLVTLVFTLMTILVAMEADRFGGVLGLIITWFAGLLGPVSIPMLLGLLPQFRHCNATAAITTIISGLGTFVLVKYGFQTDQLAQVASPLAVSLTIFTGFAVFRRNKAVPAPTREMMVALSKE
ncbi:MAG: sodium:solute symporter family protein [Candidatus Cyclobacteriaceae bacterium M3_2C_046]